MARFERAHALAQSTGINWILEKELKDMGLLDNIPLLTRLELAYARGLAIKNASKPNKA